MGGFKCPRCGGTMKFDEESGRVRCEYCGTQMSAEEYDAETSAGAAQETVLHAADEPDPGTNAADGAEPALETSEDHVLPDDQATQMDVVVYTCKSCGAELVSLENEIVSFCSYCGNESMLEGKLTRADMPRLVIPFSVSREECARRFREEMKTKPFVPRIYRTGDFENEFRGIYVPFWVYEVHFPRDVNVKATYEYTEGEYDCTESIDVHLNVGGRFEGVPQDASSQLNDEITQELMPFDVSKARPFSKAYLSGYYADRADVPPSVYERDAKIRAIDSVIEDANRRLPRGTITSMTDEAKLIRFKPTVTSYAALFPVWFLTRKWNGRVCYAVVNGESGKVHTDLPVDLRSYLIGSLLLALPIFGLMCLLLTVTAKAALGLCTAGMLAALGLFIYEIMQAGHREYHVGDKGYPGNRMSAAGSASKKMSGGAGVVKTAAAGAVKSGTGGGTRTADQAMRVRDLWDVPMIAMLVLGAFVMIANPEAGALILCAAALYTALRAALKVPDMKCVQIIIPVAVIVAAIAIIWLRQPVQDWWYYLCCILCLAGILLVVIGMFRRYNYVATRSIPVYHERRSSGG